MSTEESWPIDSNFPCRVSSVSVLLKSEYDKSLLPQSRSMDATGLTMDDVSSIDTDAILETSVYGNHPVNMGGSLHQPLFSDDRVQKILNESRKKIRKNATSNLIRSAHGVSPKASRSMLSPQNRDIMYSESILNKHRSFLRDGYDKSKVKGKTDPRDAQRSSVSQDSKKVDSSRFVGSLGKLNIKSDERNRSSVRNLTSNAYRDRPGNVGIHSHRQTTPQGRTSLHSKLSSTSDFSGSSLAQTSKSSDLLDINSQRTSGYHSDALSPDYRKLESRSHIMGDRNNRSMRPNASSRRSAFVDQGASISRKDSNSTEVLMRQPPTGIKVHQRSRTWGQLQSIRATQPDASSTPLRQSGYLPRDVNSEKALDRPIPVTSRTVSNRGRMPPYSNPHSTANARIYSDHQAFRSGDRDGIKTNRLSDSALSSRPGLPYTNWKSSALTSRKEQFILREEDTDEDDQRPEAEYVQQRYVAADLLANKSDGKFEDDDKGQELEVEDLTQHNKTWPSVERLRERSKMAYMKSKQNTTQYPFSSWTAEKRSIPLRPQNPVSVRSSTSIGRPVSPGRLSSTPEILGRYHTTAKGERRSKSYLGNSLSQPSYIERNTQQYYSDDDNITVDTDMLLTQPPMPIVDASPSVSSVSDDDVTIRDASSESDGSQSFADLPVRSSSRVSFAPSVSFNRSSGISPLSKFESTNPRTAGSYLIKDSIGQLKERSNESHATQ